MWTVHVCLSLASDRHACLLSASPPDRIGRAFMVHKVRSHGLEEVAAYWRVALFEGSHGVAPSCPRSAPTSLQ
ncbi:hypothetical protein FHW19_001239 [Ochrobactrum anthropi]|nr:hypothetical protein [Brucella anthropi]NIH76894.1 hypothetical protein [Ochrobactrum sp. P20RRXII]